MKRTWKLTPEQRIELLRRIQEGDATYRQLAADFGCSARNVQRLGYRHGVKKGRKDKHKPRFSERDRKDVAAAYLAGQTIQAIADHYGVSYTAVRQVLVYDGVDRRSLRDAHLIHSCDETVFDTVTEESAYWAGFCLADGCISERSDGSPNLIVALEASDREHLEAFSRFLKTERPVPLYSTTSTFGNGQNARLVVSSLRIVQALASYGIVPRKSFTAKLVGLENNPHAWRGVVDGDGWVSAGGTGQSPLYPHIGLVGSLDTVEQFASFVRRIDPTCEANVHPLHTIWSFHTTGRHALRLIQALYGTCTVALARKLLNAQQAMRWVPGNKDWSELTSQQIQDAYAQAGSWNKAAASIGCSRPGLRKIRTRLGMR